MDRWRKPLGGPGSTSWRSERGEARQLERRLEDGLSRTRSIAVGVRLVAEEVRSFASINPRVGKGLLIVTVPKQGEGRPLYIETPMPPYKPKGIADHFAPDRFTRDSMGFIYVPPDLSAPAASYSPVILGDNVQFKEGEAWAEKPPWWDES